MKRVVLSVACAALVAGCASNQSQPYGGGQTYSRVAPINTSQIGSIQGVIPVRVLGVRAVEREATGVGGTVGAIGGGALGVAAGVAIGKNIGGGSGKKLAKVTGGVIGGILGASAGKSLGSGSDLATEYVLERESGGVMTIVLDGPPQFQAGQHAYLTQGHPARLVLR